MNWTQTSYPFYSYNPSGFAATILSIFVYISLIAWFLQSLHTKCRPLLLFIFVFVAHLTIFIELVIRGTLAVEILSTKILFRITSPLCSIPARLLLFANYHCLVELRGKKPHRTVDRAIDILVLVVAVTADILLAIADELSFHPHWRWGSFHFRQASAGLILSMAIFFYLAWYVAAPHVRRLYVLPLLSISSICVLIEAVYVQILSFPSVFVALTQNELWFYAGHVIPIVLALCTWSIYHPGRLLPPLERDVPHDSTGKELLPTPSLI